MPLEKPTIDFPGLEPPDTIEVEDIKVGDGEEATAGNTVSVHYVGVSFSTGEQFDASWDRGQAFEFNLGGGQVIKGWDEGVQGMKVGGRRKLTLPPQFAYGDRGAPPVIQPGETLIFVVDLLNVK